MSAMEVIDTIMQWIVAPVAGFVLWMYRTQQDHATKLAVLLAFDHLALHQDEP